MIGKMNVYLLRHEERDNDDISFSSTLTSKGLSNADTLIRAQLMLLKIDNIYCSPFIRSLQTIAPYCRRMNKKVNIEWALMESVPSADMMDLSDFHDIINKEYVAVISTENKIRCFKDLFKRINKFFRTLDFSQNNLLVTHLPVINAILLLHGDKKTDMFSFYDYGTLIYI